MISDVNDRTAELSEICKLHHVARLDLYGKAVTADSLTENDSLNFLVDFKPSARGAYADAYFGLLESLEMLFGWPVELTTTNAMATNPFFRPSVVANKVKLYGT